MYTVSGNVRFDGKIKSDDRDKVLKVCETMLEDLAMYAQEKYPDYVWDASPVSLWTKLSKVVKVRK